MWYVPCLMCLNPTLAGPGAGRSPWCNVPADGRPRYPVIKVLAVSVRRPSAEILVSTIRLEVRRGDDGCDFDHAKGLIRGEALRGSFPVCNPPSSTALVCAWELAGQCAHWQAPLVCDPERQEGREEGRLLGPA